MENALRDPVSGEIGKSIIFAVSQNHAAKLAQILKGRTGKIIIRGHTDAVPFASPTYDNWRLSSARRSIWSAT